LITANVIHRVFRISYATKSGTTFSLDVDGKQYLVTAKHVVPDLAGSSKISLWSNGAWKEYPVQLVGHAPGDIDVSVLAIDRLVTNKGLPLEAGDRFIYGQDSYFLGFPYGIMPKYIFGADGFPLPFVKKALVSSFNPDTMLLDGHNNPGFSGGPVVFMEAESRQLRVAGVVSGFRFVEEPVLMNGQKTGLTYEYNTGIVVAHRIHHALALIKANPIGCTL